MKNINDNDKKIRQVKSRVFAWYGIIGFGIMTIVLSLFSLFSGLHPIFPLSCFLVETFFGKWYAKLRVSSGR